MKKWILIFFIFAAQETFSQKITLKYLTAGYQLAGAHLDYTNISTSYSPSYPYFSLEGFINRQFYFKVDFTIFILLGSRSIIDPYLFSSQINNMRHTFVSDVFSPLQIHIGHIQVSENSFLMPLGLDLSGIELNEVIIDNTILGAPVGYAPQLIIKPNKDHLYRIVYAFCFNLPGQDYLAMVHKLEAQVQIIDDEKTHWQLGLYLQSRKFMMFENGQSVTAESLFVGARVGYGINW